MLALTYSFVRVFVVPLEDFKCFLLFLRSTSNAMIYVFRDPATLFFYIWLEEVSDVLSTTWWVDAGLLSKGINCG